MLVFHLIYRSVFQWLETSCWILSKIHKSFYLMQSANFLWSNFFVFIYMFFVYWCVFVVVVTIVGSLTHGRTPLRRSLVRLSVLAAHIHRCTAHRQSWALCRAIWEMSVGNGMSAKQWNTKIFCYSNVRRVLLMRKSSNLA